MTTQKNPPLMHFFVVMTVANFIYQAAGGEEWLVAFERSYFGGMALLYVCLWRKFPCLQ